MHDRYKMGGWSLRPVWLNRRRVCAKMGDAAGAAAAHRRYVRTRRDVMSDSAGQDAAGAIDYADFRRDDKLTVGLAREQLADPGRNAKDVIHAVVDSVLAYARRGEWAEAAANVARAVRLLARNRQFFGSAHDLLAYLTVTGDLGAAARFFDKDFAPGVTEPGEFGWVGNYQAGLFLARRLTDAGRTRLSLKVPPGFVPSDPGERVGPKALREHLEAALPELCARADGRNGNTYYTDRLADLDEFAALAAEYARSRP